MSKIILALYILATSSALVILKWGTKTGLPIAYSNNRLHLNANIYTVSGLVLYAVSFVTYVYLISKYDLGYILPLALSFVYILIFISSAVVFKEVFTPVKIGGIFLILLGIVLLNVKK